MAPRPTFLNSRALSRGNRIGLITQHSTHSPFTYHSQPAAMFPTLVRRLAQTAARQQLNAATADPVYKLKKVWPPDMKSMTAQQQLRFEKKYKRRLMYATARPRWDKFIRLAQLCATAGRSTANYHAALSQRQTDSVASRPVIHCAVHGLEQCADAVRSREARPGLWSLPSLKYANPRSRSATGSSASLAC